MFNKKLIGNSQKAIAVGVKRSFRSSIFHFLLPIAYCLMPIASNAQCAMCRAVLETEEGGKKGEALNDGIVYLMAFPYLLVGGLGYYIYRTRLQKKK